ncbi:MAG: nitrogenase-stabilizing/protective protein NifW [Rhizomicrobium sp.]|nr:nitrogenase-stabilizing/protective protein NifW [Rhizomicrobium sp.]
MSAFDEDLAGLSSAEEFLDYFGLAFDTQVIAASRLHILKQFHDNLAEVEGLETLQDEAKRAVYREQLTRAYQRFITGTALTERVFPRLVQAKGAFVALSSLRLPPKSGKAT